MIALAVSGLGSYAFLAVSSRSLVPQSYGRLVAAWVLVRVLEPALFAPLAHVMARNLTAGKVKYDRNELDWAAWTGAGLLAVIVGLAVVIRQPLQQQLLDGDTALYLVVLAALPARLLVALASGFSVGRRRFSTYGRLLAVEGLVLAAWSAALAVSGAATPALLAMGLVLGPLVAIWTNKAALRPPTGAPSGNVAREVDGRGVFHQMVSSSMAMAMLSLGPVIVKVLASSAQGAEAGRLQNAMSVSQAPLLVLNAVFVTLMPQLTSAVVAGDRPAFVRRLLKVLGLHAAGSFLAVAVGGLLGPIALRLAYGEPYEVSAIQFQVLVAAAAMYFGSQVTTQAFLALGCTRWNSVAFLAGGVTMALVVAAADGLLTRVAVAFLAGTTVTYATGLGLLAIQLRSPGRTFDGGRWRASAAQLPDAARA